MINGKFAQIGRTPAFTFERSAYADLCKVRNNLVSVDNFCCLTF